MFGRHTKKASVGSVAARGLLFDPDIRSAALQVIPPLTKLGFGIGRSLARQRAQRRWNQVSDTLSPLAALLIELAPQIAAELGFVPPPKRSRFPQIAGGAVLAAGAVYVLEPRHGAEHRQRVKRLIARS